MVDAVERLLGELVANVLFVEESGREAFGCERRNKAPKGLVHELFKDESALAGRCHLTL
jgi:hypothetical protein